MKKTRRIAGALRLAVALVLLCAATPHARAVPGEECAAGRHQYQQMPRVAPTAAKDGEADYLCAACGQRYTEILFATNHLWGAWVTVARATCAEPGVRRRTCTRAEPHDEYAAIAALGHDYRESAVLEASCLEPGLLRFVCGHDPAHSYEEGIPAPGSHDLGAWRVETSARAGEQGLEVRACLRCGWKETRALLALPAPTAPAAEPPAAFPVLDVALTGANVASLGFFAFLLIPYFICLAYIRRRQEAIKRRDALRKKVEERYGFE